MEAGVLYTIYNDIGRFIGISCRDSKFAPAAIMLSSGMIASAVAAFNIYIFVLDIGDYGILHLHCCRLTAFWGMSAYSHSTNISATYAVFLPAHCQPRALSGAC